MSTPSDEHNLACEELHEDELIIAKNTVARLTKIIHDQSRIIEEQEKKIKSLQAQIKAVEPIVNAWSARQRSPRSDYYPD